MTLRIILRRRVRPDQRSRDAEYRLLVFKVAGLSIGSGADQHVHIEHPDVAARHAMVESVGGRMRIRALGADPVHVNGRPCRGATMTVGDVATFGVARLTLEQHRADGVLVFRLNDPDALSTSRAVAADHLSLKGAGLSPRRWSWGLVLGILVVGFGAPFAAALMSGARPALRDAAVLPSDVLWQPGPLHEAHRPIGHDCNVCHTTPFQRVGNAACETCHRTVHQHVPADSPDAHLFADAQCADCHQEHDAAKDLTVANSGGCTPCHSHLKASAPATKLRDVGNFSVSHPEFALPVAAASNLTFSHQVHLKPGGIESPGGRRHLQCAGCHETDAGGQFMVPIRMETHCAACHTLQFDEHDPGSKVPHGNVEAVFKALREHFSRAYLDQRLEHDAASGQRRRPGDEQAVLSRDEQRRALAWAEAQTQRAARELFEKRVCVECHRIGRIADRAAGAAAWAVEPVRLTHRWFPRAAFDHTVHNSSGCQTCHPKVAAADDSALIHMPTIAVCRDCHGDNEARKVASTCLMCHDFHRPGTSPIGAAPAGTVTARSEGMTAR